MARDFRATHCCEETLCVHGICRIFAPGLQQLVGESATDVLPALESIFLEELQPSGPIQEAFGQFLAARQLFGHPVAISHLDRRGEALLC